MGEGVVENRGKYFMLYYLNDAKVWWIYSLSLFLSLSLSLSLSPSPPLSLSLVPLSLSIPLLSLVWMSFEIGAQNIRKLQISKRNIALKSVFCDELSLWISHLFLLAKVHAGWSLGVPFYPVTSSLVFPL